MSANKAKVGAADEAEHRIANKKTIVVMEGAKGLAANEAEGTVTEEAKDGVADEMTGSAAEEANGRAANKAERGAANEDNKGAAEDVTNRAADEANDGAANEAKRRVADKGNQNGTVTSSIKEQYQTGWQQAVQPPSSKSDQRFAVRQTLYDACIAHDRSRNE